MLDSSFCILVNGPPTHEAWNKNKQIMKLNNSQNILMKLQTETSIKGLI